MAAAAAVTVVVLTRPAAPPAPTARPLVVPSPSAPGAAVVDDLGPATEHCQPAVTCAYAATVTGPVERAFRGAFLSAGYIGRQQVRDGRTGRVLWQLVHFTTGTLVTVTLTQQPVDLLPAPPVPDNLPSARDLDSGSIELTALRDGYLMTVSAAALPGQSLPVNAARRWLETVPAP